ncbi:hypothetical protein JW960_14820 [candidate division KSB1 bacterium]|nr:hypothetical protein [candidate division KSB1 bacterium]
MLIRIGISSKIYAEDPTTLVFPPYLHTYGIRKATKFHLFLLLQNRVKFRDPQGLAVVRLACWEDTTTTGDDDEVVVYGVNSGQNNIIYNTSMSTLGVYGLGIKGNESLNKPNGITANGIGDVYVADTGNNRVVRLFNPGNTLEYITEIGNNDKTTKLLNFPNDVALDSQGNLYVADTGNHRIVVYSLDNLYQYQFGELGTENGKFQNPSAIIVRDKMEEWTYYRDNFILVIDLDRTRIQKFSLDGTFISALNCQEFLGKSTELEYVDVDYYCNVYATDRKNHCIHKFDRRLNYLTSFGKYGKGDKEFIEPRGITIYRRFGQVFIAEKAGAQYYWMGTDCTSFGVKSVTNPFRLLVDYTLTEPSFVTADVFNDNHELVTRIWNQRFQQSGSHRDLWEGRLLSWPDSVLAKDNLTVSDEYQSTAKIGPGNYEIVYCFEPTYSSFHYFAKEMRQSFQVEVDSLKK